MESVGYVSICLDDACQESAKTGMSGAALGSARGASQVRYRETCQTAKPFQLG